MQPTSLLRQTYKSLLYKHINCHPADVVLLKSLLSLLPHLVQYLYLFNDKDVLSNFDKVRATAQGTMSDFSTTIN